MWFSMLLVLVSVLFSHSICQDGIKLGLETEGEVVYVKLV